MITETDFSKAYRFYFARMVNYFHRSLPEHEAEELVQLAWTRGWEKREQLRNDKRIFTWVMSIGKNLLRAKFRKAQEAALEELPDYRFTTQIEASIAANQILAKCSDACAARLRLAYYEGTVAKQTMAFRMRLFRDRRDVRKMFAGRVHAS